MHGHEKTRNARVKRGSVSRDLSFMSQRVVDGTHHHDAGQTLVLGNVKRGRHQVVDHGRTGLGLGNRVRAVGIDHGQDVITVPIHAVVQSVVGTDDVGVHVHDITVDPPVHLGVVPVKDVVLQVALTVDGGLVVTVKAVTHVVKTLEGVVIAIAETVAIGPVVVSQGDQGGMVERVHDILPTLVVQLAARATSALDITGMDRKGRSKVIHRVAKVLIDGTVFVVGIEDVDGVPEIGQIAPEGNLVGRGGFLPSKCKYNGLSVDIGMHQHHISRGRIDRTYLVVVRMMALYFTHHHRHLSSCRRRVTREISVRRRGFS